MKNLKRGLPILGLVLAIMLSAFTNREATRVADSGDLHWYDVRGSLLYLGEISKVEAMDETDCEDETETLCARGYTVAQLAGGNPQSGPSNVNVFSEEIFTTEQ